ncbi:hypothetical protein [Pseudomonas sp. Ant30-3]|uniref:hypothetical protein n=1 Tax=Pseudomonas sp. Ant30-3 TaxID=1488328 RepID=UPI000ACFCA0F|nr:hypothetical protein [Pseudomonas sp. Ant30-3]
MFNAVDTDAGLLECLKIEHLHNLKASKSDAYAERMQPPPVPEKCNAMALR